ncbi:hypoxia up-regulated protein 1-like [Rhopilema esculentum]|uniref:hypoxia up-regulated protein 1-like n=1 Tax=Rhopilema esculentum TaxID=499914 RepID=UPI0031E1AAD6
MLGEKLLLAKILASLLALLVVLPETESIAVMSIDLGSEWIKVAIVKPGVPMEIALNKESRRKTPNAVAFKDDERHFSDPALGVAVKKPENSYLYLTHLLGKKYENANVELYRSRFPHYNLVKDEERGTVLFKTSDTEKLCPEELMAMILNNSRQIAENFADHPMKDVVLTVSAFYTQAERKALIDSAKMVGLNVLQLMNDNTAVALNYGIFRAASFNSTETHVMFYDMGATSTTVTIVGYSTVKTKDRGYLETVPQLAIKGVGFDPLLGGLEMEFRLRNQLVKLFKEKIKTEGDIEKNPRALMKLLKEAARVKRILSANTETFSQVENLFEGHDFRAKVTRDEFEEMCKDLFDRVSLPVETALKAAAMQLSHVDTVMLMGGGTRVPKVQELLKKAVKRDDLGKSINTDEAAALGAVYRAADLTTGFKVKRFLIKDVNMFPIDVSFFRKTTSESGQADAKVVTRTLFHRLNPLPQKKVMTFNKQEKDFHFNVSYGDTSVFSGDIKRYLDLGSLRKIDLSGVAVANENNKEATPKGVKAFFNMDDSGILTLDKVEAHFEKKAEEKTEEEQSTFAKIGNTLSSLFGSSKDEEKKEEETKEGGEKKEDEKKSESESKEDKTDSSKEGDKKKTDKTGKEEKKGEKEDKKAEKEEDQKDSKTDDKTAANAKESNTTANKTEKPEVSKPVLVKENISLIVSETDILSIGETAFAASVKHLDDLHVKDLAKRENEQAKNSLESFLYEFKDKLYSDNVEKLATEEETNKISEKFSEVSDWLMEDGYDATADVYKSKLKELEKATEDLRFRISEDEIRPKAIAELLSSLNLTNVFKKQFKAMPEAYEIYTEKDLKDLEKVSTEVSDWLATNWKKQNETDPKTKPVLLVKDIVSMQGKLDRELLYLINKAKYYVPKPKPKANTTAENKTASNTTKAEDKNQSTKEDEKKKGKDEKLETTSKKEESEKEEKKKTDKTDSTSDGKKDDSKEEKIEEAKPLELPEMEKKESKPTEEVSDKSNTKEKEEKAHKEL